MKNPHAVALGRKGGLAGKGKPGRKLTSEQARAMQAARKDRKGQKSTKSPRNLS